MSVAACLLLYSLAVIMFGPPLLRELTRAGHAPRLGVAAWLTAIGSVLISWLAAAVLVVLEVGRWDHRGVLIRTCLARLHGVLAGDAGAVPQSILLALAVAAVVAAAVAAVRIAAAFNGMRGRSREHARAVRLVGHRTGERDVVIIDTAHPAAYCVSGHPPAIVVTSGAVAALDDRQLAAVLAHERAHLAGHHTAIVAGLRALATAFPGIVLMTAGRQHVSRLLEMCADDAAARRHGARSLLSGLIALCRASPEEALAAADVAVVARAERLAARLPHPDTARARAALTSVVAVMAAGPLLTVALAATGAVMCGM